MSRSFVAALLGSARVFLVPASLSFPFSLFPGAVTCVLALLSDDPCLLNLSFLECVFSIHFMSVF